MTPNLNILRLSLTLLIYTCVFRTSNRYWTIIVYLTMVSGNGNYFLNLKNIKDLIIKDADFFKK